MPRYFALIPAAGSGSRIGGEIPKQFLTVAGKSLLAHAVATLAYDSRIKKIFVVTMPEDPYLERFSKMPGLDATQILPCGGASRAQTVLNGLREMEKHGVLDNDWVLVHDAARPCLSAQALDRLIDEVGTDVVGGILAVPVADTIKRGDEYARAISTVPRADLWQAQTPQMFRAGTLRNALVDANLEKITDEASAIEAAGMRPKLVMGERGNIKVTYADDLPFVEWLLARRSEQGESA
jgi:2-C-methyl-D-erythritol 4-phosphate cytidylyltransferase